MACLSFPPDGGSQIVQLSVVIPYGGSASEELAVQLDAVRHAIDEAALCGYTAEVILAVNDRAALEVTRAAVDRSWPALVTVVDASRVRGPSAARNVGARLARGEKLLFCDADDAVDPGWVLAMARALDTASIAVGVRHHDLLNPDIASRGWSNQMEELPTAFHHLPFGTLSSLGIHRELYHRIGGCDESLRTGEDVDLCWRAQYAGATVSLAREAVVQYRLRAGLRAQFAQSFHYGLGDALLLRLHRALGARRTLLDSLRAIAGAASQLAKLVVGYRRPVAAYVLGHTCGRVVGSARYRVWAV